MYGFIQIVASPYHNACPAIQARLNARTARIHSACGVVEDDIEQQRMSCGRPSLSPSDRRVLLQMRADFGIAQLAHVFDSIGLFPRHGTLSTGGLTLTE
jgi:hypothetical protein